MSKTDWVIAMVLAVALLAVSYAAAVSAAETPAQKARELVEQDRSRAKQEALRDALAMNPALKQQVDAVRKGVR